MITAAAGAVLAALAFHPTLAVAGPLLLWAGIVLGVILAGDRP